MTPKSMKQSEITQLLLAWNEGDPSALDKLMPLVFNTLHQIARQRFLGERVSHTLQPTAMISEIYLRFLGEKGTSWESRVHFFGAASEMMRRILLDHARKHQAAKRGADKITRSEKILDDLGPSAPMEAEEIIALDEALQKLSEMDPVQCRIVHLKFFVGMTTAEAAEVLGMSERTVKREWSSARAWLYRRLY